MDQTRSPVAGTLACGLSPITRKVPVTKKRLSATTAHPRFYGPPLLFVGCELVNNALQESTTFFDGLGRRIAN
jgi:hypothetical protein